MQSRIACVVTTSLLVAAWSPVARADGAPGADTVNLTPAPPSPPSAPSPAPSAASTAEPPVGPVELLPGSHPTRVAAYAFGGAAVAGLGVGIGFGILALNNQSSFNAHPTYGAAGFGNQEAIVSDVGFGVAVIAGVTCVVLLLKGDELLKPASSPAPLTAPVGFSVAPIVSPHGAGAGALVRF